MKPLSILIPTDLSSPTMVAVRYVAMLADTIPVKAELLHMIKPYSDTIPITSNAIAEDGDLARNLVDEYISGIDRAIREKIRLGSRIEEGEHIYEVLKRIVNTENSDLVVMATAGAHGLKKYIIGSNAASVIQNSPCPVITVPFNTAPSKIRHIVYATDLLDPDTEMVQIASFARLFDAWIHVLHIFSRKKDVKAFNGDEWLAKMRSSCGYHKLTFYAMAEDDIARGINKYLKDKQVDLLAVFSNRKNYAERMMQDSVSLEEAMEAKTPVLTLYKEM